ncbi:MAG: Eco57I restriction-modification methylase domain-containing protein [Akkermansia sp.]
MSFSRYYKQSSLLFSPDLVQRVFERQPKYVVPVDKGLSVRDEAQRAYRLARAAWHDYLAEEPTEARLHRYVEHILTKVLGYSYCAVCDQAGITAEDPRADVLPLAEFMHISGEQHPAHKTLYPITLLALDGGIYPVLPVIIAPPNKSLDDKIRFSTGKTLSATQMMQSFLNASEYYTWAIVTNGANWRLLRDNPALSRPCYLDIDLDLLMQEEDSTAFDGLFWHLLHVTRASRKDSENGDTCVWEKWRQDLEEHGARARDGLREGVENAICQLGTGFLQGAGTGNEALRNALQDGSFTTQAFYQELMRTVYRLIFLAVLEGRNILHEHNTRLRDQAELYRRGYSVSRLIKRALRDDVDSRHDDLWQAQQIVFRALAKDSGEPALALPALGGLFDTHQCTTLDACRLPNRAFLAALRSLCWTNTEGKRTQVDYAHIGAEELGSVYESLLELTPRISTEQRIFYFMGGMNDPEQADKKQKGNARKLTGSYYTPTCLVEQVLKTTLDPLLDECCKNPAYAQQKLLALRVIDPACGSGHFLLGAARRIAERLAEAYNRRYEGIASEEGFRRAMHDVIRHCIYGVDINPMAIELMRMNLWLEGYQPGKALSFLDAHLRCGNSLLGIFSADTPKQYPVPADAYKCLPGDDAEVCKALAAANRKHAKDRVDKATAPYLPYKPQILIEDDNMPEDSPSQVQAIAEAWQEQQKELLHSTDAVIADLWIGAFLVTKSCITAVPTTGLIDDFLHGVADSEHPAVIAAQQACRQADVFHWHLAFPEVFQNGGFDCVLGNPPWERAKIQEKEWFANRCEAVAKASNAAARKRLIDALGKGELPGMEPAAQVNLHAEFHQALHLAGACSLFFHVGAKDGGRYPLSGVGDVNMYALFAETNYSLKAESGRAGFIVPTNIATDAATSAFFGHLVEKKAISSLYDLENRAKLFPEVDSRQRFCCFTLAPSESISVACYMTHPKQLEDKRRIAHLSIEDFAGINPNTGTCPLFRCEADAALAVKLYQKAPILINEKTGENPWGISFCRLLDMSNASHLFLTAKPEGEDVLPLYEGKLIHHYDHRFNIFTGDGENVRNLTAEEHNNPACEITPRYWVRRADVISKLPKDVKAIPQWFMGFRDICRATDERTLIMSFLPFAGVGNSLPLVLTNQSPLIQSCFVANATSLVMDFCLRMKVGGTHINFFYIKQFPFLPPSAYTEADIAYISSRVLELSYTSYSMCPLAEALGYTGEPFPWDEDRRAQLKAELDAYYAKLYGLTREDLAYILDPTTKYPTDCPTVTFPTLQNNEMKKYGEYRTQRLVLAAFDELTRQGK